MSQKFSDQKIQFCPKTPKNWSRNLQSNSYKKNLETSPLPTKKQNNKKKKNKNKKQKKVSELKKFGAR